MRQSEAIEQITVCDSSHSISLFADDILIYIKNWSKSLPHLMEIFKTFSNISGYKINWSKSAMMLLGEQGDQTPTLNFPIPVVTNFKYLGVSIFPSLDSITINNYNKVLKDMEEDLTNWDKFPTSFQSRLSVIRMNVLPRVNFVSSMIPLTPPNNYWKKLHSTINQFLWNKKKQELKPLHCKGTNQQVV